MSPPQILLDPIQQWISFKQKPILISGPCSAESEEQILNEARQLAQSGMVSVFRAGIWKPRTRPNSFEGVGDIGLQWLMHAKQQSGLPVATEVANAKHVEACLKAGIDVLWIGARTTANPFSVQEIADALKGVHIPIMVKNPINPDLQLWLGAFERLYSAGITQMLAVHRGFSSYSKSVFRNLPMWEIPIELKAIFPEIEIICDPSHIAGNRQMLAIVAQKAMDLNMAGLMIESHPDPDNALSDKQQQITPAQLTKMIHSLSVRVEETDDMEYLTQLEELRSLIDEIDTDIIKKLANRIELVERIGEYKKENNITILQLERWKEILQTRGDLAKSLGLSESFTKNLLDIIHNESIRLQTDVYYKPKQKH
jgi:chorismate mutase